MSNPCVNRWGLNTFWHHFWYSDNRYALYLRQDDAILRAIQLYILHGWDQPKGLFWNNYWFKTSPAPVKRDVNKYYRWITVVGNREGDINTYQFRLGGEEIFQTQIHVLRFNGWFLINFYWFQPDKRRKKRISRVRANTYIDTATNRRRSLVPAMRFGATLSLYRKNITKPTSYLF